MRTQPQPWPFFQDWQRPKGDEKIRNRLPIVGWTFLSSSFIFQKEKLRRMVRAFGNCAKTVLPAMAKGRNGVCCGFSNQRCTHCFTCFTITDRIPLLTNAQKIFIFAIPSGFQIVNQKTRRRTKTLKGSLRMGGGRNLLRISAPLPVINSFRTRPLLAWSISMDSTFKTIHLASSEPYTQLPKSTSVR